MGAGPLNHRGEGETSNHESSFAKATEGRHRTLNTEFPERGLQSASTFAASEHRQKSETSNIECAVPKGRSKIARRFNAGLAALPFKSRRDGRNSRAEIFSIVPSGLDFLAIDPGVKTPGYSRLFLRNKIRVRHSLCLSPAAAGQTRLEFSQRGLHWRPAATGLLPTAAFPRIGRDGAPAPSAPLSGATLRVNCAMDVNYTKGVIGSARCYAGGDGAGAPSLPIARKLVIDVWNFSGAWMLVLGAFRRKHGCRNLELFTSAPLWP